MEKQTFLTFKLGLEYFAVNVIKVLEVLERQQITRVPQTPAHILGILNFRGEILPVINTRCKFNLPSHDREDKNLIIVYDISTETHKLIIAATADSVKDVIEIDPSEIKPVPEMGLSYDTRYIAGVIRRNDTFILLIHPDKVFSVTDAEVAKQLETVNQ